MRTRSRGDVCRCRSSSVNCPTWTPAASETKCNGQSLTLSRSVDTMSRLFLPSSRHCNSRDSQPKLDARWRGQTTEGRVHNLRLYIYCHGCNTFKSERPSLRTPHRSHSRSHFTNSVAYIIFANRQGEWCYRGSIGDQKTRVEATMRGVGGYGTDYCCGCRE